jgi:RimJ/RimL family protein N-acetyltransferase
MTSVLPPRSISGAPVAPRSIRPPQPVPLEGTTVRLEPLDAEAHANELYAASHGSETAQRVWDYLPYGPFADPAHLADWIRERAPRPDPFFFAVRDRTSGLARGVVSFLNIVPAGGSIEIGHIWFGPALQNTRQSTEALYLLMTHAFDTLGYRRLEWKCNARNAGSRSAARRLGFAFEGIFYQHTISKGHNRDTAWFSILDGEWSTIQANFQTWLAPANFDPQGQQIQSLGTLNAALRPE